MKIEKQLHYCEEDHPFEYAIGHKPMICEDIVKTCLGYTPRLIKLSISNEHVEGWRTVRLCWKEYRSDDVLPLLTYYVEGHFGCMLGSNFTRLLAEHFYNENELYFNMEVL